MAVTDLFAGGTYRERVQVDAGDSADRWGNTGLLVLSTPAMLGRVEQACVRWVEPRLPADRMTVGVSVEMSHLAPLPLPGEVEIQLELRHVDGDLFDLEFQVLWPAREMEPLGRGLHRRALVDRQRFLSRVERRRATAVEGDRR
jgi:predicted thioesterase